MEEGQHQCVVEVCDTLCVVEVCDMELVLMPMQGFRRKLDPASWFDVPQLRELILQRTGLFKCVVLMDQIPPGMDIKAVLKLFHKFKIF